jgi:hypothetical protein
MFMAMRITIDVPEHLGHRLQRFRDRLPEILEQGIRVVSTEDDGVTYDEREIMALLSSQPTPEQVLAIRPSPALQQRVSELLQRNKDGVLSRTEVAELDRYLTLEHLVRLAKGFAYQQQRA